MNSIEVRFVKDTQNRHTGWEFYPAGSIAHFNANHADALIAYGMAVTDATSPPEIAETPPPPSRNFSEMSTNELKAAARDADIKYYYRMKRETLIEKLIDGLLHNG